MLKRSDRNVLRLQRHTRLRKRMAGSPQRPRLSVFRSLKHVYAQIVDDSRGVTLAAASTMDPELRVQAKGKKKSEAGRSEEHTSELQSHSDLVCRLLLEKKKKRAHKH